MLKKAYFPRLQKLWIGYNQIDEKGVKMLCSCPWNLDTLYLSGNYIADTATESLTVANFPLKWLWLSRNVGYLRGSERKVIREINPFFMQATKQSDGDGFHLKSH